MRTRSCNVVRATLVACGTIGLLSSLAAAQQKADPSPKLTPAQQAQKQQTLTPSRAPSAATKGQERPFGTTPTASPVPAGHSAGGGVVVRGPGAAADLCASAPVVGDGTYAFDTSTFTNDVTTSCAASGGPDGWWEYVAPNTGPTHFETCGLSANDTALAIYDACGGSELACLDDGCGLQTPLVFATTAGTHYWVRIGGFAGQVVTGQLFIGPPPPPPDCIVCPPGSVDELELDCGISGGVDTVNGGCNSTPPVFTPISVGQTACGTGAFDGSFRDTDWYEFTLAADTQVTWDVTAEFDVLIGFINSPCPQGAFIAGTAFTAGPCTPVSSSICLPAGTYYAFVAPQFTSVFACGTGAGNRYTAALSGVSCMAITPPNDDCAGVIALTQDVPFFGDNTNGDTTTPVIACSFGGAPTGPDVFFSFTPATSDNYIVSMCGSGIDTFLSVHSNCPGDDFDILACNDDFCGLQSELSVALTGGTLYTIRAAGWNGAQGAYTIVVTVAPPPPDCATCPPGSVDEAELDCGISGGVDTVNGGCNSTPPVFTPIAVGQTACGTGAFDGSFRDTDWYEFTLVADTQVTWDVIAEFDVLIGLINSPCPQGAFIAGTAFTAGPCTPVSSSICLPAGTYYAFVAPQFTNVFACGTGSGSRYLATLSGVTCTPPTPPANDLCENAIVVSAPSSTPGTTIAATASASTCIGSSPDVFYSFTPPVTGTYTIDLCGSLYDTSLAVYTDCTFGTQLACNDDSCGLQSSVTLSLTGGTAHIIRVGGFGGQSGDFTLNISAPPAPPTGACCVGASCTIVTAADCATAGGTYQGDNSSCVSGTFTSNPNLAIPDNQCPATVTDSQVIGSFTITSVAVRVQIPDHTFLGDLQVSITNGVNTVQLWLNQCGGNNGMDVTFQDGAPAVLCGQPTVGTYSPNQPLSAFNGQDAAGTWTLIVCDDVGADVGTLTSWSLIFDSPGLPGVCGPAFCDADWCQDGSVGVPDIFCFLSDWFANDPDAVNYGGNPGVPAIFAFLAEWFATPQGPCTP